MTWAPIAEPHHSNWRQEPGTVNAWQRRYRHGGAIRLLSAAVMDRTYDLSPVPAASGERYAVDVIERVTENAVRVTEKTHRAGVYATQTEARTAALRLLN